MTKILKFYSFKDLYRIAQIKNPIFNIKKFEVYISLIISIVISSILVLVMKTNNDVEYIISNTRNILVNTAFGLLGVLGFIISGLAIISGTIGTKVTQQLIAKSKFEALLSILFSFYYIGLILGILISLIVVAYFLLLVQLPLHKVFFAVFGFVISYGLFFSIFYCFSLLGTCINIFVINYKYSREEQDLGETSFNKQFFDARIDAILLILLKNGLTDQNDFIKTLIELIERDCPEELKEKVKQRALEYYDQ